MKTDSKKLNLSPTTVAKLRSLLEIDPTNEVSCRVDLATGDIFDVAVGDRYSAAAPRSPQKERELGETSVSAHTHPFMRTASPTAGDVRMTAIRGQEIIVAREEYAVVTALTSLPIEEIERISDDAWEKAENDPWVVNEGESPIWKAFEIMREKLPYDIEIHEF